jgi:predicted permease
MAWNDILLRLRALFFRKQAEQDLQDELQFHREMQTRKLGDSAEAQRQARINFGSVDRVSEEMRDARGISLVETLAKDLRFAVRMLRKSPGFTAVAVITLALSIGANAVVFGILNALILRPLNLPRVESLYGIDRNGWGFQSYPNYIDVRDRNRSFEDLAAYGVNAAAVDTGGGNPSPVWGYEISGNYFDVLNVQPYLGRLVHASDEHGPNTAPYIVLSYAYWRGHFQADRNVVGRVVPVNRHPFTVIGVAPPEFQGTILFFPPAFYVPIVNHEQLNAENNRLQDRANYYGVMATVGHLKTGVTPAQAVDDLNGIGAWLAKTYPKENSEAHFTLSRPALHSFGGPISAFVAGLMLLAALILLAACANLGNLFAARAADRAREVALRLALGASRGRILQQLFTEALLISIIGGGIGLVGSVVLLRTLSVWQPVSRFPLVLPLDPDAHVYLVALLLAIVSGFLFGAVPVRQVFHTDPYQIVKSGSLMRVGRRRMSFRDVSLVAQIAICAVLVTASLVAARGLMRSLHGNFGFEPQNAMLIESDFGMAGYRGGKVPEMQQRILDEIQAIPGVTSVGLVDDPPLALAPSLLPVFTDQQTDLKPAAAAGTVFRFQISPDYLRAAGTLLLAGRPFTSHDDKDAPRVAVINQEFARTILGTTHPAAGALGKHFKLVDGTRVEVVGIVEGGKYFNIAEQPRPAMFLPILQSPSPGTWLVVRSGRDTKQLMSAIDAALRHVDTALPFRIQTWPKEIEVNLFPSRVAAVALGGLGVMASMLSVTGIFGLAAYSVSKRMKELGIRVALGANRKEVLQVSLGRAVKLLGIGSAAGLVLGILASRVLAFIVYQATPRDPIVLTGAVLAMALLGLLASWIPARRALSINPLALLREE